MFQTRSGREISYYGRKYAANIKRKDGRPHRIDSLDALFRALLGAWCQDTAHPSCQKEYDLENDPTYGQCAITAMLVCDMFGGTIHKIHVSGGGTHYFNRIDGRYIDLTSDQFQLYHILLQYEPNEEVSRMYCGKNPDTKKRYDQLNHQVSTYLATDRARLAPAQSSTS